MLKKPRPSPPAAEEAEEPAELATGRWDLNRLVVPPGNPVVGFFDLIVAVCVVFSSVVAPMKVAYRAKFLPELEVLTDAVFWLDIALQFCSGFEERGYPVLSFKRVARRYASTWLMIDLLAVFPWELISRHSSFVALGKTVRLVRLRRLLAHTKLISGDNVLRVLMILSFWLLITHWCACFFFALGWSMCGSIYDETWVVVYFDGTRGQGLPDLRDSCGDGTPDEIGSIHVRALYWALATMSSLGYGAAPVAVTNAELLFAIFCQLLGACLAAAIFSNIAKLIEKLDAAGARYTRDLDKVDEFGLFYKLPRAMRRKLHAYVSFKYAVNRGIDIGEATSALPPTMQEEAYFTVHAHVLRRVPMFAQTDDFFVKALVRVLRPQVLLKGDFLFRFNAPGDSMFFIERGDIEITNHGMPGTQDNLLIYCTLGPGSYFGELAMLTSQRRTGAARAGTDCILSAMRAVDFNDVIKDFPKYYDDIIEGAMDRLEATLQSNAGSVLRLSARQTKRDLMTKHAINRDSLLPRDSNSSFYHAGKCFRGKVPVDKPTLPVTAVDATATAGKPPPLKEKESTSAKGQRQQPAAAAACLEALGETSAASPTDSSPGSSPGKRSRLQTLKAWKAKAAEDAETTWQREELDGLSYEEAARARAAEKFGMEAGRRRPRRRTAPSVTGEAASRPAPSVMTGEGASSFGSHHSSLGDGIDGMAKLQQGGEILEVLNELREMMRSLRSRVDGVASEVAELRSGKLSPTTEL